MSRFKQKWVILTIFVLDWSGTALPILSAYTHDPLPSFLEWALGVYSGWFPDIRPKEAVLSVDSENLAKALIKHLGVENIFLDPYMTSAAVS